MKRLTIGILLCDSVAPERLHIHGDYPAIFTKLLRQHAPDDLDLTLRFYDVKAGHYPERPEECHGYLTTGASTSVNDDDPWIAPLTEFIRRLHHANVKLFGICFGHQMIAHALGGRVELSTRGWGVGVQEVAVATPEPWMTPDAGSFQIVCSHQDQVVELPPNAVLLGSNSHCPISLFRCGSLLGIQGHPEFSVEYGRALLDSRADLMPESTSAAAHQSFATAPDHALLVSWIFQFLCVPGDE